MTLNLKIIQILIFLVIFIFAAPVRAQIPPMTELESQDFITEISQIYTQMEYPVLVHYANIRYVEFKNSMGDEEYNPVLSDYPGATIDTGLSKMDLFMESQPNESCHIILVRQNYDQLKTRMINPLMNTVLTEKILFRMYLIHELGHCIEYQNMQKLMSTGWNKKLNFYELLNKHNAKEIKIWSESFADSFAAVWMIKLGYHEALEKMIDLRESRKEKDPSHYTANALRKINFDNSDNICAIAHEARGGEKILWPVCK